MASASMRSARWTPRFQYVAALAPVLSIAALALWWADTRGTGPDWDSEHFAWRAILLGGLYAAAAFALLWNAARPGFWAALAVAAALAHFLLCLVRAARRRCRHAVGPDQHRARRCRSWSAPSGWRAGARRMPGATEALGYCAAGVAFFIAVAIALELSREWITVAYAVEFAAVAGIASRLGLQRHAPAVLAAARRRGRALRAQSRGAEIPARRHPDLQLDPVGLRPVDRGLRRRPALPAADRRRAAGARDRGGDRPAGLRAADPRGAQRLPPRRHDGARRALHGARVLCPGVGRLCARRAVAGAHARATSWRCGHGA